MTRNCDCDDDGEGIEMPQSNSERKATATASRPNHFAPSRQAVGELPCRPQLNSRPASRQHSEVAALSFFLAMFPMDGNERKHLLGLQTRLIRARAVLAAMTIVWGGNSPCQVQMSAAALIELR